MKSGWKTTEFWLVVMGNLVAITETLKGTLPPEWSAISLTVLNAVYSIVRTIAKKDALAK